MAKKIPPVVEDLYLVLVPSPNPELWPDYLQDDPTKAHGLWSFYQGLQLGLQLSAACLEDN